MPQNIAEDYELTMIAMIIAFFVAVALLLCWLSLSSRTRPRLLQLEGVVPPFLGLPAILFSLSAALLATSVWENYNMANKSIRSEASGLITIIDLAQTIPSIQKIPLADYARSYARSIIEEEWKTLSAHGKPAPSSQREFEALRSATFRAVDSLNNNAESKALMTAMQTVNDGRKARLSFVSFDVHSIRWYGILLLAVLVQLAAALVHITKPKALCVAMGITTLTVLIPICTIALTLSSPYIGIISVSHSPLMALMQ